MIPDILSDRPLKNDGIKYNNIISISIEEDVTDEPVSDAEAKAHLRVDFSETGNNNDITRLRSVAREQVEDMIMLALAPKRLKVGMRNELGNFRLPYWTPEGELTEITDEDGKVIDANTYELKNGILKTSFSEIVYVEYTTGFTSCPAKYKEMILERLAYLYNNRGDSSKTNNGSWLV